MRLFFVFALVAVLSAPAFACPRCGAAAANVSVQAGQSAVGLANVGVVTGQVAAIQAPAAVRLTLRQRRLIGRQVARNTQLVVGTGVATQAVVAAPTVVAPVAPPPPPAPVLAVPQGAQLQQSQPKRYQLVEMPDQEEEPAPEGVAQRQAQERSQDQAPAKIHTFELVEQPQQVYGQVYAQQVYAYAQPAAQYFQTVLPALTTFATVAVQPTTTALLTTGANAVLGGRPRIIGGRHTTTVKVRSR